MSTSIANASNATKSMAKPPPTGPTPPAPVSARPAQPNGVPASKPPQVANGAARNNRNVKRPIEPPDPVTMYESVRSRIAALEEEEVHGEEEERTIGMSTYDRNDATG
jgi:hypothetical protein